MASTIAFYTGDGATTDFTVPFDYLAKKFVRVSLGVTILKGGDYGDTSKDYYFLEKTKVRLKVPPQEGELLTIRRYTSATDRVVSFKDASVLKATDLDVASVQTIHIAEEARDIINDALIKDKEGNWDAKGNRIINVGTPEADSDALAYGVYKADALGAYQSKLDADRARDRAVEAETNSKKSEENAKLSEVNAQASADTAVSASKHADAVKVENQAILQEAKEIRDENKVLDANTKDNANVAQDKANEAKISETNAKKSEVNSKESEGKASASAELAKQWATKLGATVDDTEYSAKYYANKANEVLTQVATDVVNSVTAEGTKQVGLVSNQGTTSVNAVKAQQTTSVNAVTAEGTKQVDLVSTEGTKQVDLAKAQAALAKQYANQAVAGQLQADWTQTDSTERDFIKNKPTLGTLSAKNSLAYSELTGVPSSFTPSSHTHPISQITNLQASLDAKTNDADLQVDLMDIRKSISNVSSKVDGIGDTLSPTYAKKQAILDACDKVLTGTNPVNAVDPTFINQLAEKLSNLGTIRPLGFHYLHPYETVPADSIICNGATYSRALYKDFFDYITTQGWVKTEAEWQKIASESNGCCPFYSSGDGSTNFRTPKFAPYQQIAMNVVRATTYHEAGLPNIKGYWNTRGPEILENPAGGSFIIEETSDLYAYGHEYGHPSPRLRLDASRSSPAYGRSNTVQPESHVWVMCVVAYGIATNVGSVDIQNVMSAVNAVQANLAQIPQPSAYVTQTWRSGTQWYRRWSNGWLEQGGHGSGNTCTFPTVFSNTNYTFVVNHSSGYNSHPDWLACYENRNNRNTSTTGITTYEDYSGWDWYACGY